MSEEEFEEEEEDISISQTRDIENLRIKARVKIDKFLNRKFGKNNLNELSMSEADYLEKELERYVRDKEYKNEEGIQINGYKIRQIENGFFEVSKNGAIYNVNPVEGLCDCPDMKYRTKTQCKHIEMIINNFPEVKKQIEEREKRSEEIEALKVKESQTGDFVPIDRWDEREIVQKLTDEKIKKYYVYEFEQRGKMIIGLTADCITDIAHWMGGIETIDEHIMEVGDKFMAKVTVKDMTRDFSVSGFAEEPKCFSKGYENKFAGRVAYRKAQRNALRRLIPKFIEERIIERYKEISGGRR